MKVFTAKSNGAGPRATLKTVLFAGAAAIGLAACSSGSGGLIGGEDPQTASVDAPCPRVHLLENAERVTRFKQSANPQPNEMLFKVRATDVKAYCKYTPGLQRIDVSLDIRFFATKGPAIENNRAKFQYFVLLATTDKAFVDKTWFNATVPFPRGAEAANAAVVNAAEISIPARSLNEAQQYIVYTGVRMDENELRYNRLNPENQ